MQQASTEANEFNHSLKELTEILIKFHGLHEGRYELAIEFQVGIGPVGNNPGDLLPGAIVRTSKIGLHRAAGEATNNVVDAATVNPRKKPRKMSTQD